MQEKTLLFGVPAEILLIFVCAEILLSRVIAPRESCAGLFFRVCAEISILGELFTSAPLLKCDVQQLQHSPVSIEWLSMCFDSLKQTNKENKKY